MPDDDDIIDPSFSTYDPDAAKQSKLGDWILSVAILLGICIGLGVILTSQDLSKNLINWMVDDYGWVPVGVVIGTIMFVKSKIRAKKLREIRDDLKEKQKKDWEW